MMPKQSMILDGLGNYLPAPEYKGLKFDMGFFERHARKRCKFYKRLINFYEKGRTGPIKDTIKVGRNEPCPCGSLMKFKYCHWAQIEAMKT